VIQLTDVHSVRKFVASPDTFFTLLGYNPDTRRLATIQGEIRIGSGHQVLVLYCFLVKSQGYLIISYFSVPLNTLS